MRADADERFAQDVIERSKGRDRTAGLEKSLVHLAETVELESRRFKRDELSVLSIMRLESLARHWNFFARELSDWRRELKQVTSQYTEDAAELARRRALWEATRAAAGTSAMAPALSDRIGSVLAEIDAAEVAVSGPIGRQISLSQRANVLETGILAGQKAVAAAISYNDHRLAKIDSPPLWEAANDPQQHGDGLKSLETGLKVEATFLDEYREATQGYRNVKTVVALLMLPLLIWLSIRSRKVVSDDPEIQAAARVLRRPISSWLVLLMVSVVVFEPNAPMLMHQVAMFIALVPVLRLLPQAVYSVLGPWPYVATGLYLLASAVVPVPCGPLLLPRVPARTGAAVGRAAGLGAVEPPAARRRRTGQALAEVGASRRLGGHCGTARRRRGQPDRQRLARRDADRRHPRERLCGARAVRRRDRARLHHPAAAGAQGAVAIHDRHAALRAADAELHDACSSSARS